MKKVLFVCHGNICRSVMAEFIFKNMVSADEYYVESAAVSREEIGNDMYPPAKAVLREQGVPFESHRARQVTPADYDKFDEIYVMDDSNVRRIMAIFGEDPEDKVKLLLDRGIADPWYTGDFEISYRDIVEGCKNII